MKLYLKEVIHSIDPKQLEMETSTEYDKMGNLTFDLSD